MLKESNFKYANTDNDEWTIPDLYHDCIKKDFIAINKIDNPTGKIEKNLYLWVEEDIYKFYITVYPWKETYSTDTGQIALKEHITDGELAGYVYGITFDKNLEKIEIVVKYNE